MLEFVVECVVAWEDPFDRPVQIREGKLLMTLADARDYILSLSPEHQKTHRALAATEALLMAATRTGRVLDAEIRMIQLIQQENELNLVRETSDVGSPRRRSRA